MKKLLLGLLVAFGCSAYAGTNAYDVQSLLDSTNALKKIELNLGEKGNEIALILVGRYVPFLISLGLQAQDSITVHQKIIQDNKGLVEAMDKINNDFIAWTKSTKNPTPEEVVNEFKKYVQKFKKPLFKFTQIYMRDMEFAKQDLLVIKAIIHDVQNPSKNVQNLAKKCVAGIKNGVLFDENVQKELALLNKDNELLACLVTVLNYAVADEEVVWQIVPDYDKFKELSEQEKAFIKKCAKPMVKAMREYMSDFFKIFEQAIDTRLAQA